MLGEQRNFAYCPSSVHWIFDGVVWLWLCLAQTLEVTLPGLKYYFHEGIREACAACHVSCFDIRLGVGLSHCCWYLGRTAGLSPDDICDAELIC